MFCEQLFAEIENRRTADDTNSSCEYQVTFSMLEIYNEKVRDLLNNKSSKKAGLTVRQHPKKGFYGRRIFSEDFSLFYTSGLSPRALADSSCKL